MISIKIKHLILTLCVFVSAWLLIAQTTGSLFLLLPCLACFFALSVWSAIKGLAMPVLLFFLPFSSLLRVGKDDTSFFTIALLAVYLVYIVKGLQNIGIYHLIPGLAIIALTMVVKTLYGYSFDNSYILFSASLLLIPFLSREINGDYDFYWMTLFFVIGISLSAITAQYLVFFPNISRFINTFELFGATRFSGYYGDPNFYSAHITAALGGVLIQLLKPASRKKVLALIIMASFLMYCGLISLSKSFFLIAVCLILLWLLALLFGKGKISAKVTILIVSLIGIAFLLSTTVFTDAIDSILDRFSRDNSISDFTTRRTDIWAEYIHAIINDPMLLLFGNGYDAMLIGERASHNTVIQSVFQFGLIGSVFLTVWLVCFARNFLRNISLKWSDMISAIIILIGAIGPWMAIDALFFDEFFLMPIFACFGIRFLSDKNNSLRTVPK